MTTQEYFNLCKKHDWYFAMSDDSSAFRKGVIEKNELERLARKSEVFEKIYYDFCRHVFADSKKPDVGDYEKVEVERS